MIDWIKPFPITSVYRTDLKRVSLLDEQVASLTDLDMLKIAQKMQILYLESVFWKHLLDAVGEVLQEKEQSI